jgi:hypothetical protein
MQPLFLYPLAFLGLSAVPALAAIYLLRNRFRRQVVSSLVLWADARESRSGGARLRRLQTPLLFLLELLVILLLVFSASDPQVRLRQGARPLVVVLDDSFSMLAGGERSPRNLAVDALKNEFARQTPYSVRFVLAGERAQVLGEPARDAGQALALLETWRCHAPAARLDEAVALGAEVGGELALLLVLTDHAPAKGVVPERGRLAWWAFGKSRPNLALVNAARTSHEGADRCLLEVANLSDDPARATLVIEPAAGGKAIRRTPVALAPGETQRLVVQFPPRTPAVRARIIDPDPRDELPLDDEVVLLPPTPRPVRVDVRLLDRRTREPLERALRACRGARLLEGPGPADLVFADKEQPDAVDNTWLVRLVAEEGSAAYTGPFVLDRAHPLTEGLSLRGTIWGTGKGEALVGAPVVMAGNTPLLSDAETPTAGGGARHDVRMRFRPELSTLQKTPDWVILVSNLVGWRAAALPGLDRTNVRLGEQVLLTLPSYREGVTLTTPAGGSRPVSVKGRQAALGADEVGVHEVLSDETAYRFAVNALAQDESDLRDRAAGRWGDWLDDTSLRLEYRPVSWVLLLVLLGLGCAHLLLMAKRRTKEEG